MATRRLTVPVSFSYSAVMSKPPDQPPSLTFRKLQRQPDPAGRPVIVGFVRSAAVYRRIRQHLAGDIALDGMATSGLHVHVDSVQHGGRYTGLGAPADTLAEALEKLARHPAEPGDLVTISDDAGPLVVMALAEFFPSPRLDRLLADGNDRVEYSCARCPRRSCYQVETLIARLGAGMTLAVLADRWTSRCRRHRAGQYTRCRPRASCW